MSMYSSNGQNTMLDKKEYKEAIYYNLVQSNNTGDYVPISFVQQLGVPFIHNCSEYDVSVIRFSIPNTGYIFSYNPDPEHLDETGMFVTLKKGTATFSQIVEIRQTTDVADDVNNVYEISTFMYMLNDAIQKAFTGLSGMTSIGGATPAYFIYDNVTHLMSLVASIKFYTHDYVPVPPEPAIVPIEIYVNTKLYFMIESLPNYETTTAGSEYKLLVENQYNNTIDDLYYQMTQEKSSFDQMCAFNTMVMESNLPSRQEYYGSDICLPILTDFMAQELSISTYSDAITYNAQYNYRRISLNSQAPLTNIALNVFFVYNDGTRVRAQLYPGTSASVKLMFTKKERA